MSNAVLRAVREMLDAEKRDAWAEAEIVGSGREFWLGTRRVSSRTVTRMLQACLLRSEGLGTEYEIHTLNEDGRALAADPNYIPRIYRALGEKTP